MADVSMTDSDILQNEFCLKNYKASYQKYWVCLKYGESVRLENQDEDDDNTISSIIQSFHQQQQQYQQEEEEQQQKLLQLQQEEQQLLQLQEQQEDEQQQQDESHEQEEQLEKQKLFFDVSKEHESVGAQDITQNPSDLSFNRYDLSNYFDGLTLQIKQISEEQQEKQQQQNQSPCQSFEMNKEDQIEHDFDELINAFEKFTFSDNKNENHHEQCSPAQVNYDVLQQQQQEQNQQIRNYDENNNKNNNYNNKYFEYIQCNDLSSTTSIQSQQLLESISLALQSTQSSTHNSPTNCKKDIQLLLKPQNNNNNNKQCEQINNELMKQQHSNQKSKLKQKMLNQNISDDENDMKLKQLLSQNYLSQNNNINQLNIQINKQKKYNIIHPKKAKLFKKYLIQKLKIEKVI